MLKKNKPIQFKRPGSNMERIYTAVLDGCDSKHMLQIKTGLKPNQVSAALINLATVGMVNRVDTPVGNRYQIPGAKMKPAWLGSRNNIGISKTKGGRPTKPDKQKPLLFRPQSKEARDAFYRLGGSRWINRLLAGAASTTT
jgi:hypothetical protein